MNDETLDDETLDARAWCTMAGAARATGRSVNTLVRWLNESAERNVVATSETVDALTAEPAEPAEPAEQLNPRAFFASDEARQSARRIGKGRAWRIKLDALKRVHFARGGVYWSTDAAHAVASLPLAAAEERRALLAQLDALAREVATLRALASSHTSSSREHADEHTDEHAGEHAGEHVTHSGRLAGVDELDATWESFNAWVLRHALDYRTAQRLRAQGVIPLPTRGLWRKRHTRVREAYTPEQRARADDALARWQHAHLVEPLVETFEERLDETSDA